MGVSERKNRKKSEACREELVKIFIREKKRKSKLREDEDFPF